MTKTDLTETLKKLVGILEPLSSDERQRVINAALALIGETNFSPENAKPEEQIGKGLHKTEAWLKQNKLTTDQIQQVFHLTEEGCEVIAHEMPGKNAKEKTHNAYVLTGIAALLLNGEPSFDDKTARGVCKTGGCLNEANHAAYIKDIGNVVTGSKDKGWQLTAPGLKKGASLISELNKANG